MKGEATRESALERAVAQADLTVELSDGVLMPFRRIEPGEFRMGSRGHFEREEPAHLVRLSRPFLLGTFPVTQRQFAEWTRSEAVEHENGFPGRPDHPAEKLDWHQAVSFCAWLTNSGALPEGWAADLPTEAQWEYACRAGADTDYWNGDGEAALQDVGWYSSNSGGSTRPVGLLPSNPWGLHDMHGNVWEWCHDAWDMEAYRKRPDGAVDPVVEVDSEEKSSSIRVIRGGSWDDSARWCRSAYRYWGGPGFRFGILGFRVCLLPGPVAQGTGRGAPRQAGAEAEAGEGRRGGTPSRQSPVDAGAQRDERRRS